MGEVLRNTIVEDTAAFQAERLIFLEEQRKFKFGYLACGLTGLNTIESMYAELVYAIHVKKNEAEAIKFLSDITALRKDLLVSLNNPAFAKPELAIRQVVYRDYIERFGAIYLNMKRIKRDCGLG